MPKNIFKLLSDIRKGLQRVGKPRQVEAPPRDEPASAAKKQMPEPVMRGEEQKRPPLSFEELSRIAREAHETAQRAIAVREKIAAIRGQAGKLAYSVTAAQRAQKRLEKAEPFSDDSQRSGEFLIERGFLFDDFEKKDRAKIARMYTEQLTELRDAISVLSGIDAPSAKEKRRLDIFREMLDRVDAAVVFSAGEYGAKWREKRDAMLRRIGEKATVRANTLKAIILDSLKDPEIFTRLQEEHPALLDKIERVTPGIIEQARARIDASRRRGEYGEDFFKKLIEKITAPDGGIETYLALQTEILGKLESAISHARQDDTKGKGEDQANEFWDTVDEYSETKNINSKRMLDLKFMLLDVVTDEREATKDGKAPLQPLENYMHIIQRMEYISFLATLQAFIRELDVKGQFEKVVPDQAERRKIVSKVTTFIDNNDVLEALLGDVLELVSE